MAFSNAVMLVRSMGRGIVPDHHATPPISAGERKRRVLVVEDEAMISMLLEDMVSDAGAEIIGPIATFEDALVFARRAEFEVAVLDLNLNGKLSYPIAQAIRERRIPVIFATGYGIHGVRDEFRDCPVLQKPFSLNDFVRLISAVCHRPSGTAEASPAPERA